MKDIVRQISPSQVSGRLATWHRVMEEVGLTFADLQKVIDNPELRRRVVAYWQNGGFEPSTSQKRAREIMGKNFFGVEDAIKHFGVNPSEKQFAALSEIPFSESVLEELKDTHILIAVFPFSILSIREKEAKNLFYYSHKDFWYSQEPFAKERGQIGWRLIRKTPVPDSTSKNWEEQQTLLNKQEEVPSAQAMVYTIIGHCLKTGERLFGGIYVYTSSLDSGGCCVPVGVFDLVGLAVGSGWVGHRNDFLGLSSARKPN